MSKSLLTEIINLRVNKDLLSYIDNMATRACLTRSDFIRGLIIDAVLHDTALSFDLPTILSNAERLLLPERQLTDEELKVHVANGTHHSLSLDNITRIIKMHRT